MTRRYFEDEMRYLHEAGKAFAEAHPEEARYLNVDSISDRDPYVERLFEGFAFLAGRIHERLDDELPEYTESLFTLLAPHFLKPVPALSIVEFRPEPGLVQRTTPLERGLEVRSGPVGEEGAACRFTTTREVKLQPIHLEDVALQWSAQDRSSVRLTFDLDRGVTYEQLTLSPLPLYFHADASTASVMQLFFTRQVTQVVFSSDEEEDTSITLRGQKWVRPVGLTEEEGLLPYGPYSFSGFQLLQEYLCYRRKFWFAELRGLDRFHPGEKAERFHVEIFFDRAYPEDKRFGKDNVRLYCAPVANLFAHDAEPIRVEGLESEYRLIPSARYRHSIDVYDVQEVVGTEEATGERHTYTPFFTFQHVNGAPSGHRYTTTRRIGPADRPVLYLSLHGAQDGTALQDETLSLSLRCTNGSLPHQELQEGMIFRLAPEVPRIATPHNLARPTLIRYPPVQGQPDFFWKLLSHWSLNYLSVARREALLGLLALYDWTGQAANQRRLEGIREVHHAPKEIIARGAVLRGTEVTIRIQQGFFADEGDVCLFGQVMSAFFSRYATINSFVHLVIEMIPSGKTYRWTPKRGTQSVL